MAVAYERHRISVDEYHRMDDAGIFDPDKRIELIEGELIETVGPMNPPHAAGVAMLTRILVTRFSDRADVRCRLPVILNDYSEPHPDFAVVRTDPRYYLDGHPQPASIFLLVEIADSSRDEDQRIRILLYGRSGVTESWLVDLIDDRVVIYRDPTPKGYGTVTFARRGETIAPLAFPNDHVPVNDILPPR